MMILTNLHMQNYKKYREFTLEFVEGLTGIIGRNGSGKSTIFDAITFALYGDVRGEKDTVRNAKSDAKDAVVVTLLFEIEGTNYKVIRELRGKTLTAKAYLYDGDDNLIAESSRSVTVEIIRLIGMNKEAFMHTVFASQKELTALSGLKSEERKKIIRKLLGLEKIDKIEQEIKSKLTQLNRDIKSFSEILLSETEVKAIEEEKETKAKEAEVLQKEVDKVVKNFESKTKEVEALDNALKDLQKLKDEFIKLGSYLELFKSNLTNQQKNKTEKEEKLKVLKLKAAKYEKEKLLIEEYKSLELQITNYQKQKELFLKKEGLEREQVVLRKQYEDDKQEINMLKKKLEAKSQLLKDQDTQNKFFQTSESKLKEIESKENKLNKEIAGFQSLINDTDKKVTQIQNIGKDSNCPTCTRPLLEEYDNVIASLQGTITLINTQEIAKRSTELKNILDSKTKEQEAKGKMEKLLQKFSGDLRVLEAEERTLAQKEEEFKKVTATGLKNKQDLEVLKDVKYHEKEHSEALAKNEKLKPKYDELLGLVTLIAQIPTLENELKAIEVSITQANESITKQSKVIAEHSYDDKVHEKQVTLHVEVRKAKDEISEELSKKKIEHTKVIGDIRTLKSKLDRNEEQKKQLQTKLNDKNDYEKLKAFMGEFKNKINSQIAPRISQLASDMYGSITRGKYQHIEVSNEFDFFIYDDGFRYPIERFSGGEVDLANLVLRIAISKTLSELSGSGGIGFLAFDEVFGSQDEERRFEIMEAFHSIKEHYRQIFLISHESEIKEMFERVIEL